MEPVADTYPSEAILTYLKSLGEPRYHPQEKFTTSADTASNWQSRPIQRKTSHGSMPAVSAGQVKLFGSALHVYSWDPHNNFFTQEFFYFVLFLWETTTTKDGNLYMHANLQGSRVKGILLSRGFFSPPHHQTEWERHDVIPLGLNHYCHCLCNSSSHNCIFFVISFSYRFPLRAIMPLVVYDWAGKNP